MKLPIFAHRFPIKTFKSATGYVTTCTRKMQKGERSFNLRPPNWKKSRPISRTPFVIAPDIHFASYAHGFTQICSTKLSIWFHLPIPSVKPRMNCLCPTKKSNIIGKAAIDRPAKRTGQFVSKVD